MSNKPPNGLCFSCPACGAGLVAHVGQRASAAEIREAIERLLPRLPNRTTAEKALNEWAGDNPERLAQLFDKVRARVDATEAAKAEVAPVIDPETRARVEGKAPPYPPNERDPWGLNGPAEEAARAEALKLENPRAEPQHRTMPADALPHLPPKVEPPPGAGDAWEPPDEATPAPPAHRRDGPGEDEIAYRTPVERQLGEHFKRWVAVLLPADEPVRVETPNPMKPPPGQRAKPVVIEKTRDEYVSMWLARPDLLHEACADLWGRVPRAAFLKHLDETYGGAPGWERLSGVAVASLKKGQMTRAQAIIAAEQTAAMHAHKTALLDAPNGVELGRALTAVADDPRLTEWARGEVLRAADDAQKVGTP